jgi:hypothetical protein
MLNKLTQIRDASAWKTRIFTFADLPNDVQREVLGSGPTIAHGADALIQLSTLFPRP